MTTQTSNSVRPKLAVHDAAGALRWYADHLGAVEVVRYEIAGVIVFAELTVAGTTLTVKDEDATDPSPRTTGAPGPLLDVVTPEPDAVAARMVEGGAEVLFPVEDRPYGARGGRVRDPFGVQWLLQTEVTMSPAEVRAALG
jgi:PhnB protein